MTQVIAERILSGVWTYKQAFTLLKGIFLRYKEGVDILIRDAGREDLIVEL